MRPFTLFASFNQLRHFLRTKVTELVQPPPKITTLPPSPFVVVDNVRASIIRLQQQQKHQQALFHLTAEQEKVQLLSFLQRQFPVVKVFAARPNVRPVGMFPVPRGRQFQFRTIVSSGTSTISQTGNNAGAGFSRTAVVGYSRTPFARNFSTGKPQSIFQATNTAGGSGQTSVLSQVPSRTFSVTSKMNQSNNSSPEHSPVPSSNLSDNEDSAKDNSSGRYTNILAKNDSRGIFEVVDQYDETDGDGPGLVRRVSIASRRSSVASSPRQGRHNKSDKAQYEFMRSDDLSEIHGGSQLSKWPMRTPRKPPERHRIEKRYAPRICMSFMLDGAALWDSDILSSPSSSQSSGYLDISFIRSVESAADLYQNHLSNVIVILRRLSCHGRFKVTVAGSEVRIMFPEELSVSFMQPEDDGPLHRSQGTRLWLRSIGIDPDSPHFILETYYGGVTDSSTPMKIPNSVAESSMEEPLPEDMVVLSTDFSNMLPKPPSRRSSAPTERQRTAAASFSSDTMYSSHRYQKSRLSGRASSLPEHSHNGLGPEYFKGIQEFLDHVDDLIETSDAFGKKDISSKEL
ncbi:hypothetical protein INT43_003293 [Umbelopsis isabellina]|uniref:Uncharacterized protein n=1 Tax=Mortierella isabellina TaxID=91625 RepID=A0A8H7UCM7_MORIS|nr:hypothetical protein INT43_003293 [Umbelopsis isabellina]